MIMINQKWNIIFSILLLAIIVLIGTVGYLYLERPDLMEGLYFTIVTVTSVGYGDLHPTSTESRIFYMILMLIGVVLLFYLGASIISTVIEGRVINFLIWKFTDKTRKMKNHVIICGYGDVGSLVAKDIGRDDVVIIERNESKHNELLSNGFIGVLGDSTRQETLKNANIENARALIIALNSDPDAIYTILTAKELNPEIEIYARANERDSLDKMKRAGADYVICLPSVGSKEILKALKTKKKETRD